MDVVGQSGSGKPSVKRQDMTHRSSMGMSTDEVKFNLGNRRLESPVVVEAERLECIRRARVHGRGGDGPGC